MIISFRCAISSNHNGRGLSIVVRHLVVIYEIGAVDEDVKHTRLGRPLRQLTRDHSTISMPPPQDEKWRTSSKVKFRG